MSNATFATSFLASFLRAKKQKQEKEEADQEKKARLKLFELQLAREQRASDQAARQDESQKTFFQKAQERMLPASGIVAEPMAGTGIMLGNVEKTMAAPTSVTDLLADGQMQILAMQAGMPLRDLTEQQGKGNNVALLQKLLGGELGAQSPGGMELSGVKLDASGNPMLDFSRTEIKRWIPSADGKTLIGVDAMGRQVAARPAGPSERAEEDKPLSPGDLLNFRDDNGKPPRPGITLREAQERGYKPITASEAQTEVSARGAGAILNQLDTLAGELFVSDPGIGRFGEAAKFSVQRVFQTNKTLTQYEAFAKGTVAPLIRSLGEKGNLAEGDVKRAIELLPKTRPIPDTKEVAEAKLAQIRAAMIAATGGDSQKASEILAGPVVPEGVPAGSVLVGTSGGKPVYQAPDGQRVILE